MRLRQQPYTPEAEFVEQSTLVDLLQESSAEGVGNLENGSEHPLGQGVEVSAFIGVHQRPLDCPHVLRHTQLDTFYLNGECRGARGQ